MSAWWQKVVFYQIYPRSFADSDGDGIGDLPGIVERLDYLQGLGIGAIWLSPHYPSPLFDCGYDIADYTGVAPEYGTMADFERLLEEAHQRDIRIVLDLVLNHTSHEHQWFIESASSKDNPRRDWYVWQPPAPDGGPPNNWQSTFGGSAWTLDERTGEYFYHFFLKEQPDLNWRNPAVKKAMFDAARFWLDMGVDGFRLDAIGTIYEDPDLTPHDSPYTSVDFLRAGWSWDIERPEGLTQETWEELFGHQVDRDEVHDLMKELRQLVNEYEDRVLIGETSDPRFLGDGTDELHTLFNFDLMRDKPLTADYVRANLAGLEEDFPPGYWVCNTLNNHDGTRAYDRYTDGSAHSDAQMRLALATILTLPGTPVLYNGEEIGMTDYPPQHEDQVRDYLALVVRDIEREHGTDEESIWESIKRLSRDRCRTPVQWTNAPNGGFSPATAKTWLPVNPNYANGINVAEQDAAPDSLLNFYRRLIALRQNSAALVSGDFHEISAADDPFIAFTRTFEDQTALVIINYSATAQTVETGFDDGLQVVWPPDHGAAAGALTIGAYEFLIAFV